MQTHRVPLLSLLVTFNLLGCAGVLQAQKDFKGVRPPNPEVHRPAPSASRRSAGKPGKLPLSDQIEATLAEGNKLHDEAQEASAPPEAYRENFRPAEVEYRKVLALNPNEPRGFYGLGNALTGQGRYAEAEAAYRQALLLNPGYLEVYLGLGNMARYGGEGDPIEYYKKAISLKPDFDKAYIAIGRLYTISDRAAQAIPWFEEAIRHKPSSSEAYIELGSVLSWLNRYDEAIRQYQQVIRLGDVNGYSSLAELYSGQKRYAEAIAVAQQWIKFKPSNDAYSELGAIYEKQNSYPQAIAAYQQGVRLEPNNEEGHYALGSAYLQMKNRTGAMKEYRELKRLKSDLAEMLLDDMKQE